MAEFADDELRLSVLLRALAALAVLVIATAGACRWFMAPLQPADYFKSTRLELTKLTEHLPPEPVLTARPATELATWRANESQQLGAGAEGMDINAAMKKLVDEQSVLHVESTTVTGPSRRSPVGNVSDVNKIRDEGQGSAAGISVPAANVPPGAPPALRPTESGLP